MQLPLTFIVIKKYLLTVKASLLSMGNLFSDNLFSTTEI